MLVNALPKNKHIVLDALSTVQGGGATVVERLAIAFRRHGYNVTLLVSNEFAQLPDGEVGITIRLIPKASGAEGALIFRHMHLNRLCQSIDADAILSFNYHSPVTIPQVTYHVNVIPLLGLWQRIKFVGFIRALFQRFYAKQALSKSSANFFESQYVRDLGLRLGIGKNSDVVYIGVDSPEKIKNVSGNDRDEIVMITSGQRHKRNSLALQILQKAMESDANLRLVIVGNTDHIIDGLTALEKDWVKECPRVTTTGYLSRQELYERLAHARALLTCSELESFYMVAVEAMGAGCPVVLTDDTSAKESVGDAGLLFHANDPDQGVSHIRSLKDPTVWQHYSEASLKWAAKFDATDCSDLFVQKFEQTIFHSKKAIEIDVTTN